MFSQPMGKVDSPCRTPMHDPPCPRDIYRHPYAHRIRPACCSGGRLEGTATGCAPEGGLGAGVYCGNYPLARIRTIDGSLRSQRGQEAGKESGVLGLTPQ